MNLIESISATLLKVLPREQFLRVRTGYLRLKKQSAPLLRLLNGTFTTEQLIDNIDQRLDKDWQIIMVHSSVNSLLPMYQGTALELSQALIEYCGPDRTLVMPTFNFGDGDGGAREVFKRHPEFDLRRAPSQMGLLTELFRRSPGVLQSRHPVYRIAALGPQAVALVTGHERAPSGMGPDTPFEFMAGHNAQILGIGKSFQVMTQVHHVESLMGDAWPAPCEQLPNLPVTVIDRKERFDIEIGGTQQLGTFNIWKLRALMSGESLLEWRFHSCPMFAARAGAVTDTLVAAARRGFTLYDD
ncbi:MAG: AAC(3) family N-acetyltransferase [Pseudomonadota bacterium]